MNPYEILGIPPGASDAQLREAYRALARKWGDDPRRAQQLDDAYDAVILARGHGGGAQQAWAQEPTDLSDIHQKIQHGRFDDALTLLDGMPARQRSAEWYYLKGCAQRGRGWLEEAERNFAQAAQAAPGNREYRAAYDQLREDRSGRRRHAQEDDADCGCCKICAGIMCLDCLCDCC